MKTLRASLLALVLAGCAVSQPAENLATDPEIMADLELLGACRRATREGEAGEPCDPRDSEEVALFEMRIAEECDLPEGPLPSVADQRARADRVASLTAQRAPLLCPKGD